MGNQNIKILITGAASINKLDIIKHMVQLNDNLNIMPTFTTDNQFDNVNDNYIYYLDANEANLAYKNNALFYIRTEDYVSKGVTFDDFYNNDVAYVDLIDFNNISDRFFYEFEILIVWVDSSTVKPSKSELHEVKFLEDRLKSIKYLYFLNESSESIAETIVEYLNNIEKRQELLEQNS